MSSNSAENPASIPISVTAGDVAGAPPVEHKASRAEKEYYDFLTQNLGIISLLFAMAVCFSVNLPMDIAEELAFTQDEVLELSGPGARLLAKANIAPAIRTRIVSSGEYIGLGAALFAYVSRVSLVIQKAQNNVATQQNEGIPGPVASGRGPDTGNATPGSGLDFAVFGNFAAS